MAGRVVRPPDARKDRRAREAHVRVYWTSGRRGLYGEARPILVDGARGAEVYVLAPAILPHEVDPLMRDSIVYLTCLHETGHALGLARTSRFTDINAAPSTGEPLKRLLRGH